MGGAFNGKDGKGSQALDAIGKGVQQGFEKRDEEMAAIRANAKPVQFNIEQPAPLPGDFFQQSGYLNNAMQRFSPQQSFGRFNPFYGG